MLTNCEDIGQISILKIASSRLTAADLGPLKSATDRMLDRGRNTILLDLGGVRRVARSGLAALVELQSAMPRTSKLAFYGARPHVAGEIMRCPLSSLLSYHETREAALNTPEVLQQRLAGLKAVILCAGAGTRMRPLSHETPKPMLDIAGKPVLTRVMDHLGRFGIRDFILNPGHHAPCIHHAFATTARRSVQYVNEGGYVGGTWHPAPMGSASTLVRLQTRQTAFEDDFVVLCGDAITDIDMCGLVDAHRASGAEVTIAAQHVPREETGKYGVLVTNATGKVLEFCEKPSPRDARSTLVSTGIYVFSPRALKGLPDRAGFDIGNDLLPRILARGGSIQTYDAPFVWADLGNAKDYFDTLERVMKGEIPGTTPAGALDRNGVWVSPSAKISRRAVVIGPCYVGPGAEICAGAHIEGPTVVGAGAKISGRTVLKNAIVQPDTLVSSGTWVSDMIVGQDWALNIDQNTALPQTIQPLEGVFSTAKIALPDEDMRLTQGLMG
ncbi:sugar phosphate nucleotidyltransferase [Shimia sp. Alg240-R146]|uniref:sugar phosphate nucleotidyltransferase n=1 Tax=Shimia sp. Alg240-R146 TaxID=2993449 RepID=UPI0022DF1909|nr:sugar phosphate nucleotidyltransferase [Shimia sp. Alg240-R146]